LPAQDGVVLSLPTQAVGLSHEHTAFAGTLTASPETLIALWTDIGRSLARSGLRKLILFNGHGGQGSLVDIVAQRLRSEAGMFVVRCSYYRFEVPKGMVAEAEQRWGAHAGQIETSLMLAIAPQLVRQEHIADFVSAATAWEARHPGLEVEGRVGIGWRAEDLHALGAVGDASAASAELGEQLLAHFADHVAAVITATLRCEPLSPDCRGDAGPVRQ
jgi:creatinine amidohydrolase